MDEQNVGVHGQKTHIMYYIYISVVWSSRYSNQCFLLFKHIKEEKPQKVHVTLRRMP